MSDVREVATPSVRVTAGQAGAVARALLWVLGGLAVLLVLVLLSAPELLDEPRVIGSLLLLVLAAGLPGLALMLALIGRRRRRDREER